MKWWNRWLTAAQHANRSAPLIEELEPRVLLSADAAGVFAPDSGNHQQQAPTELLLDENLEPAPAQDLAQEESRRLELVFIDTDTPDYQSIVDSLAAQTDETRQLEVILLDNKRDGIWQITRALQNYSDVDAIHLVSHGDDSGVDLGNTRLDAGALSVQQDQFLSWSNYLTADADILIYGCNLASSEAGFGVISDLARMTGADVAASEDLTGHSSLGGDWVLEVRTGALETQVIASNGLLQNYLATLAAPVANDDSGDPYASQVDSLNPESYYRLGDTSGTDESGTSTGTTQGGITNTGGALAGDTDPAMNFDGVDDFVYIPHSPAYEIDNGSISLWFQTSSAGNNDTLFSKDATGTAEGGHLSIYFRGNGVLEVRLQDKGNNNQSHYVTSTSTNLNDGQWHNVVFTFGANGMELYIDGVLEDTDTYTGGMRGGSDMSAPNQEPIAIGASRRSSNSGDPLDVNNFFPGAIDEVFIVDQQLSEAQIAALYRTAGAPYQVNEDSSLFISAANGVLANDTDADGDTLTASLVSGPSNAAAFTLNADGSFSYTPLANYNGIDAFVYQISDGNGGTDTATAYITVNPVNDAPELWSYYHSIDLAAATAEANYPVMVTLTEGVNGFSHANAQGNGEDLRFYDSAGNELDYWIQEWNNGGTSTIWVEIADAGTSAIDLYYGNPDAAAASNAGATFLLYDDFSDDTAGSMPGGWTANGGATAGLDPYVRDVGGNLVFSDGQNSGGSVIFSAVTAADVVVSQDFRVPTAGATIEDTSLIARYVDENNMVTAGIINDTTAQFWYRTTADGWVQLGGDMNISAYNVDDGNWHTQELRVDGNTLEFYLDGNLIGIESLAATGAPTSGMTGFWSQYSNREGYRDNHLVRAYDFATGDIATTVNGEGYSIDENSAAGAVVGSVLAQDVDGNVLTYSITGGNTGTAFAIDGNGLITVNNSAALDYETTPTFTLSVQVSDGFGGTDTGTISINLADVNEAPTGSVTISGTATEGQVLTASDTLVDPEGTGVITYHWQRDTGSGFVDIGATGTTYTLTQADVTANVRVEARYTDGGGFSEAIASAGIGPVANLNNAPTGSVTVAGSAVEDATLTVSDTLADADGLGPITYHWQRDTGSGFVDIGVTGGSYTLAQADVGADIRVEARYTDGWGTNEIVPSNTIASIANVSHAPTGSVTISGTTAEDSTLTASNTLADADGLGAISYQWQRDGADIAGATGSNYTLTQADVGATITVIASYTDGWGTDEAVSSASVGPVLDAGPPTDPTDPTDPTNPTGPGFILPPTDDSDGNEDAGNPPLSADQTYSAPPSSGSSGSVYDGGEFDSVFSDNEDRFDIGQRSGSPGGNGATSKTAVAENAPPATETEVTEAAPARTNIEVAESAVASSADTVADFTQNPEGEAVLDEHALRQLVQEDNAREAEISPSDIPAVTEDVGQLLAQKELAAVDSVLNNHAMWDAIDHMKDQMTDSSRLSRDEIVVQIVSASGLGLFAGLSIYALRGGALLASWLSAIPLLSTLDPLLVARVSRKKKEDKNAKIGKNETREAESLFSQKGQV